MEQPGWPERWGPIDDPAIERALEVELQRELKPDHQLFGLPLKAIGRRRDCDDVLYAIQDGSGRVADVHLTWQGINELAPWPSTFVFESIMHWLVESAQS